MYLRYLGIPYLETKIGGRWSIPEAANSVKAVFFTESVGHEGVPPLRYSEIREALRRQERPISPRTLSRALDLLESRKEVIREEIGRKVIYSLVVDPPREETISIWAAADSMMIRGAGNAGGIGDRELGWAFYGLPFSMKSRLRFRLKREVEEFQERVDAVLEAEADRLIASLLIKARGRATKRVLAEGKRGLWGAFKRTAQIGLFQVLSLTGLAALERLAPGALGMVIERVGQELPSDPRKAIIEVAKRLGESEQEAEKELRQIEDDGRAIDALLTCLPPRDREEAARRIGSLLVTRANLCAVVR